jgi:tetratricopeptide (TPR) repeat protein
VQEKYTAVSHHHHEVGTEGASCIECHMPARHYMVVDPRNDHSFRVPRPDLSLRLGTTDACSRCHDDQPVEWSAKAFTEWYGTKPGWYDELAEALTVADHRNQDALNRLVDLALNAEQPGIMRASALAALEGFMAPEVGLGMRGLLADRDPLIRLHAVRLWESVDPALRMVTLGPLLDDPVRAVRIEAARQLAEVPAGLIDTDTRSALEAGIEEYIAVQQFNADRGAAHLNLAMLHLAQDRTDEAIAALRRAIEVEPGFVPAYVNLADLYRAAGQEAECERVIREGLGATDAAVLHHVLGLSLVRQQRLPQAIDSFAAAAQRSPEDPRLAYVYAVAVATGGNVGQAVDILLEALRDHPDDADLLTAAVGYLRQLDRHEQALSLARRLVELYPERPGQREVVRQLEAAVRQSSP